MANKPFIALNLKAYEQSYGESGLELCRIAKDVSKSTGVRIVACPNYLLLRRAAELGGEVFAQHVDGNRPGAFTGSITAKMLLGAKVAGSLVNHSERRLNPENVKVSVDALKEAGLESMVCAQDINECAQYAAYKPTYIAIEPPELIGSGISVSTAKPEVITGAIDAVREVNSDVQVVCGAGVSNSDDVKRAVELGVRGVLLASAYVKAAHPRQFLEEIAGVI
ncbi:MAG: triose-phosphate isomerase [Candidatus Micrarchaeota archaeon]